VRVQPDAIADSGSHAGADSWPYAIAHREPDASADRVERGPTPPPREWVVDYEETRLSAAQTAFLAQMLGQIVEPPAKAPAAPYAARRLRPGIAFNRTA
jgi:hypothetical protein